MKRILIIVMSVLLVAVMSITGCSPGESEVAEIGKKAPDFTLNNLYGQTVSLSDYRGQVAVINFWYTGCTYCHDMLPFLQELYEEGEVAVLTVNPGESQAAVADYMEYYHLSLPVLFDNGQTVYQQYSVQYTPMTYFIDEDGVVRDKALGAFPSRAAIESRIADIQ
jgi:peroxiredoxin